MIHKYTSSTINWSIVVILFLFKTFIYLFLILVKSFDKYLSFKCFDFSFLLKDEYPYYLKYFCKGINGLISYDLCYILWHDA